MVYHDQRELDEFASRLLEPDPPLPTPQELPPAVGSPPRLSADPDKLAELKSLLKKR
jgi:hypothetical protein